jgi:50S ribosomal subunit-associated GTPase HflX
MNSELTNNQYQVVTDESDARYQQNIEDLEEYVENLMDELQPSITVTIFTKYHPATRLDPPEWEDEEVTVGFSDLDEDVVDDLKDRLMETLEENMDDGVFDSKDAWFKSLEKIDTSSVISAWENANEESVQKSEQSSYEDKQYWAGYDD